MKGKLFTLEKPPFLAVGLFFIGLAFRYFEDLRKAPPHSDDFYHAITLFIIFLFVGPALIGIYIGITITERNVTRNLEKIENEQAEKTRTAEAGNR
jgi:hypothetical protein